MAESSSCWVCDKDSVKRVINGVVDTTVTGIYGTHISTVNKDTCWVYDGNNTGYTYLIQNGVIARTITGLGPIGNGSFGGISAVDETCFWFAQNGGVQSNIKRYKVGETTISIPIQSGYQTPSVSAIDAESCFACSQNTPAFYKINTSGIVYTLTGFTAPSSVSMVDADTCWLADQTSATPIKKIYNGSIANSLGGSSTVKVSKIDENSCFVFGTTKSVGIRTLSAYTQKAISPSYLSGLDAINATDFWCVISNDGAGHAQLKKYSGTTATITINLTISNDVTGGYDGRSKVSTIYLDDNPNQAFGGGQ